MRWFSGPLEPWTGTAVANVCGESAIDCRYADLLTIKGCPPGQTFQFIAGVLKMRHTISVLVENEFGVLTRIAGLFSGRGFNIESLSVAPTLDPTISRMTIVTSGDDRIIEQVNKQLNKLIDTIKVIDFTNEDFIEREMALIKVTAEESTRAEILRICDIFRGKVVDVTPKCYTVEVTGSPVKVNAIVDLLRPMGIKELVRSGPVVLGRGPKGWKGN
jgi:acetolactate synthase-1/3 small subunit